MLEASHYCPKVKNSTEPTGMIYLIPLALRYAGAGGREVLDVSVLVKQGGRREDAALESVDGQPLQTLVQTFYTRGTKRHHRYVHTLSYIIF